MKSRPGEVTPVQPRRPWQAPAMVELPIGTLTRNAGAAAPAGLGGEPGNPPPPAAPSSKLGFSFEMSLPLSVRTD